MTDACIYGATANSLQPSRKGLQFCSSEAGALVPAGLFYRPWYHSL